MSGRSWMIAGAAGASLLLLRWGWTSVIGSGTAQSTSAPSMYYTAHVRDWTGQSFWGATRHWSRVWITDVAGRQVWSMELEGTPIEWGPDAVVWHEDSSRVRFVGTGAQGDRVELEGPVFPGVMSREAAIDAL